MSLTTSITYQNKCYLNTHKYCRWTRCLQSLYASRRRFSGCSPLVVFSGLSAMISLKSCSSLCSFKLYLCLCHQSSHNAEHSKLCSSALFSFSFPFLSRRNVNFSLFDLFRSCFSVFLWSGVRKRNLLLLFPWSDEQLLVLFSLLFCTFC